MWRPNNMVLNNQEIAEEIKGNLKNALRQIKYNNLKSMGYSKSSSKMEAYRLP